MKRDLELSRYLIPGASTIGRHFSASALAWPRALPESVARAEKSRTRARLFARALLDIVKETEAQNQHRSYAIEAARPYST
jgi:hypothetical protein